MKTAELSDSLSSAATTQAAQSPLRVLHRANPLLSLTGWANVALAVLALGLLPFDQRLVTGALVWLKPLKFSLSVIAFTWTLGVLLADLPGSVQRSVRRLSLGVAMSMMVEQTIIFVQAARGTTSHYNTSSLLDASLFEVMAVFIMLNTVMTIWALYLVWRHRPHGPAGYVWGVRLGLLLFIISSLLGSMMIHLNQHTVGAPDGGPGLPGLGWSTHAGDLRAAHFLGMHALQAVPLLGWFLARRMPRRAVLFTWLGAALYAGGVAGLFALAMAGRPLLVAGY
ncbi:hypothetical protein [Hymenobacter terrenus]|uniref:hypothetical protein n=1 Tax=Hymenobacter terrenus TaxID=1629124 RepID=UPI000697FA8E|nr:hypothetical protein [Hymenobacter terrenus]